MNNKLIKEYAIPLSVCDNLAKISYSGIVDIFMDMATEHAKQLKIGGDDLKSKGVFWVAAKTMVKFHGRPSLHDKVTVTTWPEKPGNIRSNRYYTVEAQGELLIEGKNEWSILSTDTLRPQKFSGIYPENFEYPEEVVCDTPFSRPDTDFSSEEEILSYRITSGDIDLSNHMNNVAYLRAFFSSFTCKEIEEMNIEELEIIYRIQCYEGDILSIRKRTCEKGMELAALKSDGKCAAYLRIN